MWYASVDQERALRQAEAVTIGKIDLQFARKDYSKLDGVGGVVARFGNVVSHGCAGGFEGLDSEFYAVTGGHSD